MTATQDITFEQFDAQTKAASFGFRKNRQGAWVVCGPADLLAVAAESGWTVPVTKRNGEIVECEIASVGKTFGDGLAYGTPVDDAPKPRTYNRRPGTRSRNTGTYECEECGDRVRRGTRCWETGLAH